MGNEFHYLLGEADYGRLNMESSKVRSYIMKLKNKLKFSSIYSVFWLLELELSLKLDKCC